MVKIRSDKENHYAVNTICVNNYLSHFRTHGIWESLFTHRSCDWLFGSIKPSLHSSKRAEFHTNFHLLETVSVISYSRRRMTRFSYLWSLLLLSCVWTPQLHALWKHCCHLKRFLDRCHEAPLAWSQVNNSSRLMFVFVFLVPALWLNLLYPTFSPPLHTQYRSRCVCARSHSWPRHQSTPASTPPPLPSDTLSPRFPVWRLVLYCALEGVHSIYISHFLSALSKFIDVRLTITTDDFQIMYVTASS